MAGTSKPPLPEASTRLLLRSNLGPRGQLLCLSCWVPQAPLPPAAAGGFAERLHCSCTHSEAKRTPSPFVLHSPRSQAGVTRPMPSENFSQAAPRFSSCSPQDRIYRLYSTNVGSSWPCLNPSPLLASFNPGRGGGGGRGALLSPNQTGF